MFARLDFIYGRSLPATPLARRHHCPQQRQIVTSLPRFGMPRDTLIQHNGFTGQAIHTEDGKAERIVRVDDWVGKYTFATESASARLELTVDRCDARTRRFATDTMVLEVVDAASTLSAQDGREQCERQDSGAGVPAASARSGSRTGDTDTTGVGVWLSSFVMIPWIRGPGATAVHGRRVLELGSGVGVAGLAAASRPLQPQTLTLSDCMPELVTLMEQNVALNRGMLSVQPVVQMLEWDSAHTDTFETILACDCVYKSTAAAFIRAVFALLSEGGEVSGVTGGSELCGY